MGRLSTFRCPSCLYSAHVSGGTDAGMHLATGTIICLTCRELYDIPIRSIPGYPPGTDPASRFRCPKARPGQEEDHPWAAWDAPGPCPICDSTMVQDPAGPVTLWD
jgi:hypothetical protein